MSAFEHQIDDVSALHEQLNAARERTKELVRADQALRKTIEALAGDADLSSVVGRVLVTAGEQLEAPIVEYWIHDSDTVARLVMSCREGRVYNGSDCQNDPRVAGISIPSSMTGADSLFELRGHFVSDLANDSEQHAVFDPLGLDLRAWCLDRDVTTHLNVQLRFGDRSLGSLVAYFRSAQVLTDARIELAYALANQLTLAIRMTELAEASQQAAIARERAIESDNRAQEASRISNFLNATLGQMSEGADLQLTIESIVHGLAKEIGAAHVFLFRHDAATRTIRLNLSCIEGRIRQGVSGEELPLWAAPFPDDITPGWRIMIEERGLFTPETTPIPAHEFAWPGTFEYADRMALSDMGHIVLFAGNDPVGSIGFCLTGGRKLKPTDKAFIEGVAKQAALAIRMLDLAEQAKQAAVAREQERATTEERARLAREIHDTLAQSFSGIILQLRAMQRNSGGAEDADVRQMHADNALELASTGLAEARRSLASLRLTELEGRSLREALTLMAQSTTKRSGIPVRVEATSDFDFGVENEPEILRIAQECVTNAVKHSGASQIVIALRREGNRCHLCIEDNGRGFDLEKATEGFGLIGVRERADRIGATIGIETSGAGTAVCVHLDRGVRNAS